ncbi:MAG TPA: hypothetical protein DIC34_07325 [Treponema sp.]|nr:hypothetical protein [Treponema sp.]
MDLDDVFCHEAERTVANDGTVSIRGVHYEIPSFLIGTKVKLRWNPHADLPSVFVHKDGNRYGPAPRTDSYSNARSRRIMAQDDPAQVAFRAGSDALGTPGDF